MDRKKFLAVGVIGHGPGMHIGSSLAVDLTNREVSQVNKAFEKEESPSFVLKIDPDKVKEIERLKENILDFAKTFHEKFSGNISPFHEKYLSILEGKVKAFETAPTGRNQVILLDYVLSSEVENEMAAFSRINGRDLTEEAIEALTQVGYATGIGLAEAIASVNRASLSMQPQNDSFSFKKHDISLAMAELANVKIDRGFHSEAKVEQYQNKRLGAKVGGKKHKKNPFNFRR